jgi:hypothetical protein
LRIFSVRGVCRYSLVALRLRPNFGMAHYQAAVCYEGMGMLREALTEAEKALEMAWWAKMGFRRRGELGGEGERKRAGWGGGVW